MARVAAVDCGTNSIRLLVADVTARPGCGDVHREMRVVRLGQGVDATGVLAPEAIERTRVALADYTAIMRRKGVERVRMVATSATRDAANRDDFFTMVRATLGAEAEVISGDEEARLSFVGAVGELDPDDGPFVVVDVGGGSTELVVGDLTDDGPVVRAARSVDIGCVRLTERCLPGDPPTAGEVEKAAGGHRGRSWPARSRRSRWRACGRWVGRRGHRDHAVRAGPGPAGLRRRRHPPVPAVAARPAPRRRPACSPCPATQRAALGPMHPGRVDVIGGGAMVVDELARELHARAGITELVVERARHPRRHRPLARVTVREPSELDAALVECRACPRLVAWREQVAREKRAAYRDEDYWGRPVPGFGPADAPLLIVGLAPAAHGGNRTGRMFTGDRSGDVLYAALHAVGPGEPADVDRTSATAWSCTARGSPRRCTARRRTTSPPRTSATAAAAGSPPSWTCSRPRCAPSSCSAAFGWQALLPVLARRGLGGAPAPTRASATACVTFVPAARERAPLQLFGCYHVSQQNTFTGRLTPADAGGGAAAAAPAAGVDEPEAQHAIFLGKVRRPPAAGRAPRAAEPMRSSGTPTWRLHPTVAERSACHTVWRPVTAPRTRPEGGRAIWRPVRRATVTVAASAAAAPARSERGSPTAATPATAGGYAAGATAPARSRSARVNRRRSPRAR